MRPFTVHVCISAPREDIFDYLSDLAGRVAYTDHYLKEFRLARAKSSGRGAAARFLIATPLARVRGDFAIVEHERPRRIVEEGRIGRVGRTKLWAVYELSREAQAVTRVELTNWTEPGHALDALRERFGARRWLKRQTKVALERLRMIFEEPQGAPLARTTLAGYEPLKAPRFGASALAGSPPQAAGASSAAAGRADDARADRGEETGD